MPFGRITRKQLNRTLHPRERKEVAKIAKRVVNAKLENKHTDRSISTTFGYNGFVYNLTAIAQGPGEDQRIGEQIMVKKIVFKGVATPDSAGPAQTQMRVLVYRDNFGDGVIPQLNAVLESTGSANSITSMYNIDYHKRYTILKDVVCSLAVGQKSQSVSFVLHPNSKCYFTGALATDEAKGNIYMAICADINVTFPQMTFNSRVLYTDA